MQDASNIKAILSTKKENIDTLEDVKELTTNIEVKPDLKENPKPLKEAKINETKKELSREISVDETLKDDVDKKVKITFKGKSFIKDEIHKKTAEAPINETSEEIQVNTPKQLGEKESTTEEIREKLIKAEETQVSNFTPDDYEMIAEFLIDTLDWGGSSALMYIAKDNTDTPYTLSVSKKERLKKQLTRILIKSNFKMNFGVLFGLSLILAYMKPLKAAIENRKTIIKGEKEQIRLKKKKLLEEQQKEIEKEKSKPIDIKPKKEKQEDRVKITEKPKKKEQINKKDKPTEETKINENTGAVVIDRPKGNPTTKRRSRRRRRVSNE